MTCPHCKATLTPKEVGALLSGLRTSKRGGRARTANRCACGKFTVAVALKRRHRCDPELCTCSERSWYGPYHYTVCPLAGQPIP